MKDFSRTDRPADSPTSSVLAWVPGAPASPSVWQLQRPSPAQKAAVTMGSTMELGSRSGPGLSPRDFSALQIFQPIG